MWHSDRSKPVSLVNDVGSGCRSISRFPSRVERRNVSPTTRAYGAPGHGIFFVRSLRVRCEQTWKVRLVWIPFIDEISPREIDASKYRLRTRFDASHDARPGIAFSSSLHPPTFFLSTSLPIPFRDSLSGFRHRPRRCRFFYGTSSRLSSPFARVLTAA